MPRRKTLMARLIKEFGLKCGAYARSTGKPCIRQPYSLVTGNGKCASHGGKSTGPKTAEGRAKALANLRQNRKPKG